MRDTSCCSVCQQSALACCDSSTHRLSISARFSEHPCLRLLSQSHFSLNVCMADVSASHRGWLRKWSHWSIAGGACKPGFWPEASYEPPALALICYFPTPAMTTSTQGKSLNGSPSCHRGQPPRQCPLQLADRSSHSFWGSALGLTSFPPLLCMSGPCCATAAACGCRLRHVLSTCKPWRHVCLTHHHIKARVISLVHYGAPASASSVNKSPSVQM